MVAPRTGAAFFVTRGTPRPFAIGPGDGKKVFVRRSEWRSEGMFRHEKVQAVSLTRLS